MSPYRMLLVAVSGGVLLLRAQNPVGGAVAVSAGERQFIADAAQSGVHEVTMGKLGVERATSTDVKVYAQKIIDDHTLSNAEVEALARLKGIKLPDPEKTESSTTNLSRLTGIDFDREFVRQTIDDHVKSLAAFEKEDQSTTADNDIHGFVHSMLPKLRAHLEQAKALKP